MSESGPTWGADRLRSALTTNAQVSAWSAAPPSLERLWQELAKGAHFVWSRELLGFVVVSSTGEPIAPVAHFQPNAVSGHSVVLRVPQSFPLGDLPIEVCFEDKSCSTTEWKQQTCRVHEHLGVRRVHFKKEHGRGSVAHVRWVTRLRMTIEARPGPQDDGRATRTTMHAAVLPCCNTIGNMWRLCMLNRTFRSSEN